MFVLTVVRTEIERNGLTLILVHYRCIMKFFPQSVQVCSQGIIDGN